MPENPDAVAITRPYDQTARTGKPADRVRDHPAAGGDNRDWWPERLNLDLLAGHPPGPLGADFDYPAAFESVDLDALARDVDAVLTTSQDWWPADFGHYGPLMIRMTWHCAGTYRVTDGRGGPASGAQRFAPTNSWPDNRNLDKARRLLWPVKRKYGRNLSWADLMIFAGTRALELMGLPIFGFAGGRIDAWEPATDVDWGPERSWLADERHRGVRDLVDPLAADEMGLIYVDPQGPATVPDPLAAARAIRISFGRMGFDDAETVALIAGGHTFGKSHGVANPATYLGPEPEAAPLEDQGLGWRNRYGSGAGADAIGSGLEGIWTSHPTRWDNGFLETLFAYEWEVELSPAGLWQWVPRDNRGAGTVPDAHDPSRAHAPTVLTTDLALREDPIYAPIARGFLHDVEQLADAFARAWFKLTHVDMGPIQRYRGARVPAERLIWQDPVPEVDHELIGPEEIAELKARLLDCGVPARDLVRTAWASAATFRNSDKRGGANGARIRLEPQRSWEVNEPAVLAQVLSALEDVRRRFESERGGRVSMADLIVLGGCAAVERAARRGGHDVEVPFTPGRTDATQEWTDVEWFAPLEPSSDGFRNYLGKSHSMAAERLLVDRANLLTLSAPELTALIGGLRVLEANHGGSRHGVLTTTPGVLTNDFFTSLLDMRTEWVATERHAGRAELFEGRDRRTGQPKWTATRVDLVIGSNAQLRAIAEVYAARDGEPKFIHDFLAAWTKVMNLDRYDLPQR